MKLRYGDGDQCYLTPTQAISGTTPVVSAVLGMWDFDSVGLQLITSGTITGTWLIEASNDFTPQTNGSGYGQASSDTPAGTWSDVTALFLKAAAGTAIANPAGSATNQYCQPRDFIRCRALRVTLTPASGSGNVTVLCNAGSF